MSGQLVQVRSVSSCQFRSGLGQLMSQRSVQVGEVSFGQVCQVRSVTSFRSGQVGSGQIGHVVSGQVSLIRLGHVRSVRSGQVSSGKVDQVSLG